MIVPNLPEAPVKKVIVSCEISEFIEASIRNFGIKPLMLYGKMNTDSAIKHHADIYFCHAGRNTLFGTKNICSIAGENTLKIIHTDTGLENTRIIRYPSDAFMNCVVIGKYLICNKKSVAAEILQFADATGLETIHVNQGYTKCNICVVDEKSIITEDKGIADTLLQYGLDVLLLKTKCVRIKKYNYGFIGGASGKLSNDKLAFFGDISSHDEYHKIYRFLHKRDIEPVSLSLEQLTDYGSLLPIE